MSLGGPSLCLKILVAGRGGERARGTREANPGARRKSQTAEGSAELETVLPPNEEIQTPWKGSVRS